MNKQTLALALLLLAAGSGANAQVLVNGVVMNTDSVRLATARIEIGDSAQKVVYTAISDSLGEFTIRLAHPVPPGRFFVRSEMLGYSTTTNYLTFENLQVVEIVLLMDIAAIPLEALRVAARRRYTRGLLDEYFDRADRVRRMGGGIIIGYDELQRRRGSNVSMIIAERLPTLRSCQPAFFIDGMRATPDDLRMTSVLDVEGIEIYRTGANIPPQYQSRTACGAVLVWTQIGDRGEGSPLTWRRVFIALGVAAAVILLVR